MGLDLNEFRLIQFILFFAQLIKFWWVGRIIYIWAHFYYPSSGGHCDDRCGKWQMLVIVDTMMVNIIHRRISLNNIKTVLDLNG